MKGIILCGGYGTRLRPCTEVTNKHLLPVYNKPMVYYPIDTLRSLGITDIGIVLGGESVGDFVKLLGNGTQFGLRFTYLYQGRASGIAHAVLLCQDFIADEKFITILGDNLFLDNESAQLTMFKRGFLDENADVGLVLTKVEHPEYYGVPRFAYGSLVEVIEKPTTPPSDYAVTGLYAYTSTVFDAIKKLKPSQRGELEISDAHTTLIKGGKRVYWEIFTGKWFDCGSFPTLLEASNEVQRLESKA